jgi:hypothetical protein
VSEKDEAPGLIEAGSTNEQSSEPPVAGPPVSPERHRQTVTLVLIALLATVILGHYGLLVLMEWNGKKVDALNNAYNAALPVVAGLVGSAVTYYFTKINPPPPGK